MKELPIYKVVVSTTHRRWICHFIGRPSENDVLAALEADCLNKKAGEQDETCKRWLDREFEDFSTLIRDNGLPDTTKACFYAGVEVGEITVVDYATAFAV